MSDFLKWQNGKIAHYLKLWLQDNVNLKQAQKCSQLGLASATLSDLKNLDSNSTVNVSAINLETIFPQFQIYLEKELGQNIHDFFQVLKEKNTLSLQKILRIDDELILQELNAKETSACIFFRLLYISETGKEIDVGINIRNFVKKEKKKSSEDSTKLKTAKKKVPVQANSESNHLVLSEGANSYIKVKEVKQFPEKSVVRSQSISKKGNSAKLPETSPHPKACPPFVLKVTWNEDLSNTLAEILTQQLSSQALNADQVASLVLEKIAEKDKRKLQSTVAIDEEVLITKVAQKVSEMMSSLPQIERGGQLVSVSSLSDEELLLLIPNYEHFKNSEQELTEKDIQSLKMQLSTLNMKLEQVVKMGNEAQRRRLTQELDTALNLLEHFLQACRCPNIANMKVQLQADLQQRQLHL